VKKILTAAEMRVVDRLTTERYGVPSLLLMENAARAALREIAARLQCGPAGIAGRRVLILCGRGNNGGDGAALGRLLSLEGARVEVVLVGRAAEAKGDARVNFDIVRALSEEARAGLALSYRECASADEWRRFIEADAARPYDVYVDALFGTGLTRPVGGLYEDLVKFLLRRREARGEAGAETPLFVSLDLPSGLDADRNELIGAAVSADLTVTFTAPKIANVVAPASTHNGSLVVAGIGSPLALIEDSPSKLFLTEAGDAKAWLRRTRYTPESYKKTHGHALLVAGSRDMTGAAVLCADAAMCAGAGLVTVATAVSALPSVASRLMPEVMTAPLTETAGGAVSAEAAREMEQLTERATVLAVGCGLSRADESTRRFVRQVIERRTLPIVVDADGLNALAPWPAELRGTEALPIVLTPHEGEMSRLLGAENRGALGDRTRAVAEFAEAHSLIVVLKGTRTLVAAPDGRVFVNPTGNAGLGTAGSGDTLTGIITAFLAQEFGALRERADAVEAVVAAVYVAGLAGDLAARARGVRTLVASDVRNYLSAAVSALDPEGERP
jgi:NAD(P)H-hydrate epimerase